MLGHALDELLDNYAGQEYGPELKSLKTKLVEANEQFKRATDHLKEHDRDVVDYYASDLVDMAVYTINSWLLLQDAREAERKKAMAEVYIAEHLPKIHHIVETIQAANAMPLEARELVLAKPF